MKARLPHFKPGDITEDVWSGDIVTKCEFIRYLDHGMMLFYNGTTKCFVRAFWEAVDDDEEVITLLNGWDCSSTVSEYIKKL